MSIKRRKKNGKSKLQIVFCLISILFILGCCIFYGGRFFYFYSQSKDKSTSNQLAVVIKNNNAKQDNFVSINKEYYFKNNPDNNYLLYSNILWRIIKIDNNDNILLISDDVVSNLAHGNDTEYNKSYLYKWLNNNNEDNTGILERNLNNVNKYLNKIDVCLDKVDKINNDSCKNTFNNNYIGLLNIYDYVNTGSSKSFINNNTSFYLNAQNKDGENWIVSSENDLTTVDNETLSGIKPTIRIKNTITYLRGTGLKDDPYIIEDKSNYFGSYVNLDGDIYRVYNENDTTLDLMATKILNSKQVYSNNTFSFNTKTYKTIAYYLNNTYYNSLTYKNIINETSYSNSYYGPDNDYNYTNTLTTTIKAKVGLPSIGNIIFYEDNNDFMSMTGTTKNGSLIYIFNKEDIYDESVKNEVNIIPVININKDILNTGDGSKNNPYTKS